MLEGVYLVLCIFMKFKTDFSCIFVDSFLAPFMNNLSVPMFYEYLEYGPSFPELNVSKSCPHSPLIPYMFSSLIFIKWSYI